MQNPVCDIQGTSLRERLKPILEPRPYITSLSLFGSRARGDYDALSDYDFRCDFISTPIDRLNAPLSEEINRDKVVLYERSENDLLRVRQTYENLIRP